MKAMRMLAVAGVVVLGVAGGVGPQVGRAEATESKPAATQGVRQGGPGGMLGSMMLGQLQRLEKLTGELNLSDEQKTKIKEIVGTAKEKWEAWANTHKDELEKLQGQIKEARANQDREKMQDAMRQAQELVKQDGPKPGEFLAQIKDLLTPEQQETLRTRMEEMRQNNAGKAGGGQPAPAKGGDK